MGGDFHHYLELGSQILALQYLRHVHHYIIHQLDQIGKASWGRRHLVCTCRNEVDERGISAGHALSYGREIDIPWKVEFVSAASQVPSLQTSWDQLVPIVWLPEKHEYPRAGTAFSAR